MTSPLQTSSHRVRVDADVELHVVHRRPAEPRGVLLLIPATLTTHALYDAEVGGDRSYNVLDQAATLGLSSYVVDYEGYGESTTPSDGADVTFDRSLAQMARIVAWIREREGERPVHVMGTSVGSDLAMGLASSRSPVRDAIGRLILCSTVYERFSPLVQQNAFTPEFEAFLRAQPGGIVETQPPMYDLVLSATDESLRAWAGPTFSGRYATGPTLAAFDKPLVDVATVEAPAMLCWGDADPVTTREDVDALASAYGGPMRLRVFEGGGHSVFLEPARARFWDAVADHLALK